MSRSVAERDVVKLLWENDYHLVRQNGSHKVFENDTGNHITITSGGMNKMVVKRLIKENNLKGGM